MAKCLQEEEKLAVCVQGYRALYNKAEPYFHKKMKNKILGAKSLMIYN